MKTLSILISFLFISFNIYSQCSVTISHTDVSCFGDCDGTATAIPTGQAPFSYFWNPSPTIGTSTLTGLCPGVYYVTITAANSCTATASVTISSPPQLIISVTSTPTCLGCNTGTANATASGGTPPYTYNWSPLGGTNNSANNLACGTYTVTTTDFNGCTTTAITTINCCSVNTTSTPNCYNDLNCTNANGTATAIPNGTPPYTYSWNTVPTQTTQTATGLCSGIYVVTVTDSINCVSTDSVIVNPIISVPITTTPATFICNGTATANVIGASPPYSYLWIPAPGGGQGTNTPSGLCAGVTYTCCVTDINGCQSCDTVKVGSCSVTTTSTPNCYNDLNCTNANGTATAFPTGTPPFTYSWSTIPAQTTQTATGLCSGVYYVTVLDSNNCSVMDTVIISSAISITTQTTASSSTNPCNGTATVTPTNGTPPYTYSWNPGGGALPNNTGMCPGTYTICVQDIAGCISCGTVTVNQTTSVSSYSNYENLYIYPNPSNGSFTLKFENNNANDIQIINLLGEIVYWKTNNTEKEIKISGLAKGTYFIKLTNDNTNIYTQKIIVN